MAVNSRGLFCNKMAFAVHTVLKLLRMKLLFFMWASPETSSLSVHTIIHY